MSDATSSPDTLHRDWLLGTSDHGVAVTELEWGILRFLQRLKGAASNLVD